MLQEDLAQTHPHTKTLGFSEAKMPPCSTRLPVQFARAFTDGVYNNSFSKDPVSQLFHQLERDDKTIRLHWLGVSMALALKVKLQWDLK